MENNQPNNNQENSNSNEQLNSFTTTNNNQDGQHGGKETNQEKFIVNYTTVMAGLSYLGPLVLIPILTNRDKPFILFHIKQGLVLLSIYLIGGFLLMIVKPLLIILQIGLFIFAIIGILNVLQQKEEGLPFIGKFANHIKL
ncbi:MAG: hypothetical protein R3B60_01325 [Candidatus Paceibacterota bacterium]